MKKLLIFIILLTLTGCYNYQELNELAITSGIAIDKEGEEYILSLQVINTEKGNTSSDSSEQSKFVMYEGRGVNMQEAFRNVSENIPRRVYPSSIQVLIISEDIAYEGIYNILDLYFRKTESGKQFYTLVSKDSKASDILKVITPLETLNSKKIKDNLKIDSNYYGLSEIITFEQMLATYLEPNREISLPSIYIENNKEDSDKIDAAKSSNPRTKIKLGPMAVFKDDKMLGYLDKDQSIALSFIKGEISDSLLTYECEENKYLSAELSKLDSKMEIVKNEKKVKIEIKSEGSISETQCKMDLEDVKIMNEINEKLNETLTNNLEKAIIEIIDKYNTDIFGFKDLYYKNNLDYYKKIKDDWYTSILKELEIEVKTNINLLSKGNTIKVITREKNK